MQHRLCWQLWDWASQEVKLQLVHRALDRDAWPTLQLTHAEDAAYHACGQRSGLPHPCLAGRRCVTCACWVTVCIDFGPTLQLTPAEDSTYHAVASTVACHTLTSQADGAWPADVR